MAKTVNKLQRYANPVLRSYWSVHIEAWLRSGVSCYRYCREHQLTQRTFQGWLKAFDTPLPTRRIPEKKPIKMTSQRLPARNSRAFIAFWSMHLEALSLSGLSATAYANVHPATPSDLNLRYELRYGGPFMHGSDADVATMSSLSTTPMRKRRQFTDKQKLTIVAEASDPTVSVSEVARRYDIIPALVFRWCDQFGLTPKKQQPSALRVTASHIHFPESSHLNDRLTST